MLWRRTSKEIVHPAFWPVIVRQKQSPMLKRLLPIVFILLLALALRAYRLTEIPPGLTHDEANHGREAIDILDGVLRYYFPLNYGSEPIYSYVVAGSMALFGEGLFALRLVNIIFGLAAIAATAVWGKQAFDRFTALLTAALMAVSFWPLASSREALRAGMLPFFMVVAVWFFWQIVFPKSQAEQSAIDTEVATTSPRDRKRVGLLVLGFALSIVLTFHIYLAARVAWLLFPAFLLYLAVVHRRTFFRSWRPVTTGLVLTGLLVIPMFVYLANNPQSQTRLSMLGSTLQQVKAWNLGPVIKNMTEASLAFVWPGYGDQFLAYNIPGRPVFDVITAVFFILGILISLWRWKRPAYAFLLLWFAIGIIPSLVTGPTANTTRNLAALPAVYMLPAVGFVTGVRLLAQRLNLPSRNLLVTGAIVWLLFTMLITTRDYFVRWGDSVEVRGAYQHTLVEELAYLDEVQMPASSTIISTVYPGPAHDASLAQLLAGSRARQLRWVDARFAMILPDDPQPRAIIPASTPHHPAFNNFLQIEDNIALRFNDLDPEFTVFALDTSSLPANSQQIPLADFGGAVHLLQAEWLLPQVSPGETAELLTVWQVIDPAKVGPIHPPAYTTDTVFFTHVLSQEEDILAQRDALDAPSWSWQTGDKILQVHQVSIPVDISPGIYQVVVGIYDGQTGRRLPISGDNDRMKKEMVQVPPLQVAQS